MLNIDFFAGKTMTTQSHTHDNSPTIQLGSAVVLHAEVTTAGEGEVISGEHDLLEFVCGEGQIFEAIEQAVMGKVEGDIVYVQLEPEQHVGEYDAELVRVEERTGFPDALEEGMMFEGLPNGLDAHAELDPDHAKRIYLVTDVTDDVVVLDGNHPLAGIALRFKLVVESINKPAPEGETAPEVVAPDTGFAPNFKSISRN
jgi:FKBP-type peptidyl-prolyl cis-trans isomerase SlyD